MRRECTQVDRRISRIATRDFNLRVGVADLRADWRINDEATAVFAGGLTMVGNGIELTGLGAAQAKDWRYSYLQARATSGRLFAQAYVNMSNAGDTYLLRNGAPITDRSKLYVAQIQHGFSTSASARTSPTASTSSTRTRSPRARSTGLRGRRPDDRVRRLPPVGHGLSTRSSTSSWPAARHAIRRSRRRSSRRAPAWSSSRPRTRRSG